MPIGVGTAIGIGGAVLGAGASIYGASKSAKAQKDAAQSAADTSLQVAQQNNDLFREIYGSNVGLASPYYNNGLLAGNALTDLLLGTHSYNPAIVANPTVPGGGTFPTTPALGSGAGTGTPTTPTGYAGWAAQAWDAIAPEIGPKRTGEALAIADPVQRLNFITSHFDPDEAAFYNQWAASHPPTTATTPTPTTPALGTPGTPTTPTPPALNANGMVPLSQRGDRPDIRGMTGAERTSALDAWRHTAAGTPAPGTGTPAPAGGTPGAGGVTTTAPTAQSAWDAFRNSTNYTWRYNQGLNAVDSGAATGGALDSGAARKAEITFGQNFASNELSNYMNLLAGQQAMGLSAAGAVMGVGTNYAGNVAAQNTSAANAAANAALIAGQGKANMWGAVGQGVGQLGGALYQYGMTQPLMPKVNYGYAPVGMDTSPVVSPPSSIYVPPAIGFG